MSSHRFAAFAILGAVVLAPAVLEVGLGLRVAAIASAALAGAYLADAAWIARGIRRKSGGSYVGPLLMLVFAAGFGLLATALWREVASRDRQFAIAVAEAMAFAGAVLAVLLRRRGQPPADTQG